MEEVINKFSVWKTFFLVFFITLSLFVIVFGFLGLVEEDFVEVFRGLIIVVLFFAMIFTFFVKWWKEHKLTGKWLILDKWLVLDNKKIEMKEEIYNILFVLFWGMAGYTLIYLVNLVMNLILSPLIDPLFIFISTWGFFLSSPFLFTIFSYLLNSLIEEGVRFGLIKKLQIRNPYAFIFGWGWGQIEVVLRISELHSIADMPLLHIVHVLDAGIIAYMIKKNKSALGFGIVVVIHTLWNFLSFYLFK